MSVQPVTPLRQHQQHHHSIAANSRPRRSINSKTTTTAGGSSSRRPSRFQAANEPAPEDCGEGRYRPHDYMGIMNIPPVPPTPPPRRRDHHNTTATTTAATTEDSLAPPLALLSRKRTRTEVQAEEDEEEAVLEYEDRIQELLREGIDHQHSANATLEKAQGQIRKLAEFLSVESRAGGHDNEAKRDAAVREAVSALAQVNQGVVDALREVFEQVNDGAEMQEDQLNAINGVAGLRNLFANGRALYNATTTSLAAPAEIPNKKPRLARDQAAIEASTSKRSAALLDNVLATPKQTSRAPTESGSRRPTSKRSAAVTAATAISNNSISKRRSASKTATTTTAAKAGVSNTFRSAKVPRDEETRRRQQEEDALDWKKKYKRAFKSFVFYFDGFDAARKREAEKCVKDLGAQVESFFSKQISHVVTARPIPPPDNKPSAAAAANIAAGSSSKVNIFQPNSTLLQPNGKENAQHQQQVRNSSESPLKQTAAARDAFAGPSRRSKTRLGAANPNNMIYPIKTPPKIKAFADFEKTESKDILVKAQSFGMKLWNVEKLQRVLERLMSDDSPSQNALRQGLIVNNAAHVAAGHAFNLQMNGTAPRLSLPSLLRAEALTGSTYERDLNALRPDFHYFNPKNGYILVEDSSGEFQPAHAKEYSQRIYSKSGEENRDTEWPTLWGGQEGRQAFYKPSSSYRPSLPSRELIRSNDLGRAPEPSYGIPALKKQNQTQGSQVQDPPSYLAASGNSQIITSNIQSGTSTRSGQILGANGAKATGSTLHNGYIVDKRLARLGSKNAHIVTIGNNSNNYLQQVSTTTTTSIAMSATTAGPSGSVRSELARRALQNAGAAIKKSKSLAAPKPEPKKPGYCENCRVRFDDFKVHTRTKKHRRFALDQSNWTQLDELFGKIKRPINPELLELYADADMQNDIPSDIEASDKEEEEEEEDYSDDDEMGAEDDSGFACLSFDYMPAAYDPIRRKSRTKDGKCGCDDCKEFHAPRPVERHWKESHQERMNRLDNDQDLTDENDEDEDEDDEDEDDEDEEEVVDTSEEEEALETASEDDDRRDDEE